jgi:hypothetical protein
MTIKLDPARVAEGRRQSRGPWEGMKAVDLARLPEGANIPPSMTRAFRNNRYIVTVNDYAETTAGYAVRAMVQSLTGEPVRNWEDLQRVKNECFGEETVAIEYYPAQSKLVNAHHIYWLWIYEPGKIPLPIMDGKA